MRRFIPIFTIALLLLSVCLVCADGSQNELLASYSTVDDDVLILSSVEPGVSKNTTVTVVVFAEDATASDLNAEGVDRVVDVLVAHTEADGSWETAFVPYVSGTYHFSASTKFRPTTVLTKYVMANRKNCIDRIRNGSSEELEAIFSDVQNVKGLISAASDVEGITDTSMIGKVLYGIREGLENKNDISKYLEVASAMTRLSEKKDAESLEKLIEELNGCDITLHHSAVFDENASDGIKLSLANRLADQVYDGIAAFSEAFGNNLILAGVEKSPAWVDLDAFLQLLDNQTYKDNQYQVASTILGTSYSSIDALKEAIEEAVQPTEPSGQHGGGGGGGFSAAGQMNYIVNADSTKPNEADESIAKTVFNDVSQSHWAFESINYLHWKNILNGDDQGNFLPEKNVTRAEMVKILCEAFDIEQASGTSFEDVGANDWFAGYVKAAKSLGLVGGFAGKFRPNDTVTREDMAVMIFRFAEHAGYTYEGTSDAFDDAHLISDYAVDAVGILTKHGIINGVGDGKFAPKAASTRAQAAAVIHRMIKERR